MWMYMYFHISMAWPCSFSPLGPALYALCDRQSLEPVCCCLRGSDRLSGCQWLSPHPRTSGYEAVGVLLLGDLPSHCILVLLSLNLQAAHSSALLEYLFLFLSFLCSVWSFGSLSLPGWDRTQVLLHASLAPPQRHSPRPFTFRFYYFIYNFEFASKRKHSVLTLPYSLSHSRQLPRSRFPPGAGSVSASYRT